MSGSDAPTAFPVPDDPDAVARWAKFAGIEDATSAHAGLDAIYRCGLTLDLLAFLGEALPPGLATVDDPATTLDRFARVLSQARSPLALVVFLQRDGGLLGNLLRLLAVGQLPATILAEDPDCLEMLRVTDGHPIERRVLLEELTAEVERAVDCTHATALLGSFRRRETLRVLYGDVIKQQSLPRTVEQLSFIADAVWQAALRWCERQTATEFPRPLVRGTEPAELAVIATGEWGGHEMSYGDDVSLLFLREPLDVPRGAATEAGERFFEAWARSTVALIEASDPRGPGYRVQVLRPAASDHLTAVPTTVLRHCASEGISWFRLSLVKARTAAGSERLGDAFLDQLRAMLYQRVLTGTDLAGLKMLKRQIAQQVDGPADPHADIRFGTGGIREVDFVIEFLQLLNGSDLPSIRIRNTSLAIDALEQAGCLTMRERRTLSQNYWLLRRLQHQLQWLGDAMPESAADHASRLPKLAGRLAGEDLAEVDVAQRLREAQELNRMVLDHLLHDTFGEPEKLPAETELVLEPSPSLEHAQQVFAPYGLPDAASTLDALDRLATETIPYLSAPRCRQFLAAIAPNLLRAIAETPQPPATLQTLVEIADSLGGKGALWEWLSTSRSSLGMVVRLCAGSPYLAGILTSNPGMIDDLLDSLALGRLHQPHELDAASRELCRGAEDIDPILRSFKDASHLRIGIRDILGKTDIERTHAALASTADACLRRIIEFEYQGLAERYGDPVGSDGQPLPLILIGLGKLGAREPNYHSDLELLFLYAEPGQTQRRVGGPRSTITHAHFFSQLTQRCLQHLAGDANRTQLYPVETRIRPASGELTAGLLSAFVNRCRYGLPQSEAWQRLALTKARVITPDPRAEAWSQQIGAAITAAGWSDRDSAMVRRIREQTEQAAAAENFKRGIGGTMDVEFIASALQLRLGKEAPSLPIPGTLEALRVLRDTQRLDVQAADDLIEGYRVLRETESNVRLLNTDARHELPTEEATLEKLAFLMQVDRPSEIVARCREVRERNRYWFNHLMRT